MIKKVVIPTDGYGLEDHVIRYVARTFPFADFHVISVINTRERGVHLTTLLYKEMREAAQKAVKRGKEILEKEGIHDIKTRIMEGLPSKRIIEYSKSIDADLVALRVYSRKATASAQRMGSTVKNIIKNCFCPVLLLADECEKHSIKKILFATDGSRKAERAKNFAILLAHHYNAEIEALHVEEKRGHGEEILKNVEWKASFLNVRVKKVIEHGDVAEKILERAAKNDLVIIGAGRRFLFFHYVGHVTQAVCTHSPVPVITVSHLKKRWEKRMPHK